MRPEKTAITSQNHCFGARGAGDFHFSCVLCRSKGGVDAYAPEAAVLSIQKSARTGKIGDGKIFVFDIEQAIRIRTGETGDAAV